MSALFVSTLSVSIVIVFARFNMLVLELLTFMNLINGYFICCHIYSNVSMRLRLARTTEEAQADD
jgi:hypothetical protein